jgi:hypothetical protein
MTIAVTGLESASRGHCVAPGSVSYEKQHARAVFCGLVVAEEYRPVRLLEPGQPAGSERLVIRFRVDRYWKGPMGREVLLYTSKVRRPDGSISFEAEDFDFRVGERYLVYAVGTKYRLSTNNCTRTAEIGAAREDLLELGIGRKPRAR